MKLSRHGFYLTLLAFAVSISTVFVPTDSAIGKQVIHNKSVKFLASNVFINMSTPDTSISGYASKVSILPGQPLVLKVSASKAWNINIYREGFYNGSQKDGKLITHVGPLTPIKQPHFIFHKANRTVDASNWSVSYSVASKHWKPGLYVARLNMGSKTGYVPFVVRTPNLKDKAVVVMSFQTIEAYNDWGGYSAYLGKDHSKFTSAKRSTLVTFNRPWGGKGLFQLINNELGVAQTIDHYGTNIGWTTDYDVGTGRSDVSKSKVLITSGHAEYWSPENRNAFDQAVVNGTNIMFLGGNNCYWRIRYAKSYASYSPSFFIYKYSPDLVGVSNPSVATHLWRDAPMAEPEGMLTAAMYNHSALWCGSKKFDTEVVNSSWFGFKGLKLENGTQITGIASDEMDQVLPRSGAPLKTEILMHAGFECVDSQMVNHELGYDMTYYTTSSKAAVWSAATVAWGCALSRFCRSQRNLSASTSNFATKVTKNVLETFEKSDVSLKYPSTSNLQTIYPGINVQLR